MPSALPPPDKVVIMPILTGSAAEADAAMSAAPTSATRNRFIVNLPGSPSS